MPNVKLSEEVSPGEIHLVKHGISPQAQGNPVQLNYSCVQKSTQFLYGCNSM